MKINRYPHFSLFIFCIKLEINILVYNPFSTKSSPLVFFQLELKVLIRLIHIIRCCIIYMIWNVALLNILSASKSWYCPDVHTHTSVIIVLFHKDRLNSCQCFYELHSRDAIATKDKSNRVGLLMKSSF